MAREQTVVALGDDARKAVAAAMRSRGETAATYFSNPEGGRFIDPAAVEGPLNPRTVTAGDAVGYNRRTGIDHVAPDMLGKYRQALVKSALSSGAQDAELTMNLFYTPEERAAAREKEARIRADAEWEAEKKSVIKRLDSVVLPATDSAAGIEARTRLSSIPKTVKWGESIDKANADYIYLQNALIDASLNKTLYRAGENARRGSDLLDGSLARTIRTARKTAASGKRAPVQVTSSGGDDSGIYDALYAPESVYRRMPEASLSGVNSDPTHPVAQEMMQEADNPRSRVNILLREQELQNRAAVARDRSNQMVLELLRSGGTLKPGKRPWKTSDREPSILQRLEGATLKGKR